MPGLPSAVRRPACVLGIALAAGWLAVGSADAQTATHKIPDFSGWFSQNSSAYDPPAQGAPGPVEEDPAHPHHGHAPGQAANAWVGDYKNPILKPHTAAEVKRLGLLELSGGTNLAAYQVCKPSGVPLVLTLRENVQVLQGPHMVTIIYQRDHQVRHIYMDRPHSKNPAPSWYGESVGHYEGNTLVVDTIGQNGKSRADRYGSFSSKQMHVIERYHMADGGKVLQVDFTVEDPVNFTEAWHGTMRYRRSKAPWREVVCAENNIDVFTGKMIKGTPVDDTPDF